MNLLLTKDQYLRPFYKYLVEQLFGRAASTFERKAQQQRNIEDSANHIRQMIEDCKKLRDCYDVQDMLVDFKIVWGGSNQVIASFYSLHVALWNKASEIVNNL